MFRKIHFQLTGLCASITILILFVTTLFYLTVSEKNLKQAWFSSFQSDMNTLLSGLEGQTVITHEWLSMAENNGAYIINILDNGTELLWDSRHQDEERSRAVAAGWDYYENHFQTGGSASPFYTVHTEYAFPSSSKGPADYYGCAAFLVRNTGTLSLLICKPLAPLLAQIRSQRLIFALAVFVSAGILSLFSWHFTGRLLAPIEKSRQSQIRFVAAASHELRTPLSVILSAASACRKAQHGEQEKFLSIIQEEGNSMSRLISDLLTLSDADSQAFSILPSPCEADTLLLTVYEAFEPFAKEKGYRLDITLPDKTIAPVRCDGERIRQVLSILLHNAFCYTPPGSSIRLSLSDTPSGLYLFVADDGPGIADSAKEQIFERFFRLDSAHRSDGHYGLGLSIAREIMTAHHGTISVSDSPGGGATFALRLPR